MANVKIDYKLALKLVNAEIEKEGEDHVYDPPQPYLCVNTIKYSDGTIVGSCLVGRVLIAAGVEPEELHMLAEDTDVDETVSKLGPEEIEITDKALRFLSMIQIKQDQKAPWGDAAQAGRDRVDSEENFSYYDDILS